MPCTPTPGGRGWPPAAANWAMMAGLTMATPWPARLEEEPPPGRRPGMPGWSAAGGSVCGGPVGARRREQAAAAAVGGRQQGSGAASAARSVGAFHSLLAMAAAAEPVRQAASEGRWRWLQAQRHLELPPTIDRPLQRPMRAIER